MFGCDPKFVFSLSTRSLCLLYGPFHIYILWASVATSQCFMDHSIYCISNCSQCIYNVYIHCKLYIFEKCSKLSHCPSTFVNFYLNSWPDFPWFWLIILIDEQLQPMLGADCFSYWLPALLLLNWFSAELSSRSQHCFLQCHCPFDYAKCKDFAIRFVFRLI